MLEAIKRRAYNLKNRLYLEAKYLAEYGFGIGQSIKYEIDSQKGKIVVWATKDGSKKVAKTTQRPRAKSVIEEEAIEEEVKKESIVPVIDLKASDVKAFFAEQQEKAKELAKAGIEQKMFVQIVQGKIILTVEEIVEHEAVVTSDNVVSLEEARERKSTKVQYSVSLNEFAKVVNYEQMTIFDFFHSESKDFTAPKTQGKIKDKAIRMLSLFSGSGTMDKGFKDQGYEIVFANDRYEKKALKDYHVETYKHNIGNHIVMKDIMELTEADVPEADIVVAGIPCVTFSALNTKHNFRDSESDLHPIVEKTLDIIKWSKAKAFLFENVVNFLTVKKGLMLKRIKERFAKFGLVAKIIEATELGSVQKRKRSFILGIKDAEPTIDVPLLHEVRTVKDAFEGVESAPQQDEFFVPTAKILERMSYVPQGGNILDVPSELRAPNKTFSNYCQRLSANDQSPTITHVQDDVFFHPTKERYLTVRETARLFSLPDDFEFTKGSLTAKFEMLKNAVDYRVSSFLAKMIKGQLLPLLNTSTQLI